jgi:predicted TIM-barrel fold metal-dependent hydrolase
MLPDNLISADSHVVEPPELWQERMPSAWRTRAPHVENRGETGDWFVADEVAFPVALSFQGPKPAEKRSQFGTYAEAPVGAWEPAARLKEQDTDGVSAEIIYPSNSLFLFALRDGAYQRAVFATYNDWLAEFCNAGEGRLVGVALISGSDIPEAVREVERAARLGLRGVMIQGDNPAIPYGNPRYDPLWAACEAHRMPVSFHSLTAAQSTERRDIGLAGYLAVPHMAQITLATMILGGVLERFPSLQVVCAENDIGWIPHLLFRMDHGYRTHRHWSGQQQLSLTPSDYFRRQVWSTFMEDHIGVEMRHHYAADRLMWASDYPHGESTWPNSRQVVAEKLAGVDGDEQRLIKRENVKRLYRLE